jgi:hypothetical protein
MPQSQPFPDPISISDRLSWSEDPLTQLTPVWDEEGEASRYEGTGAVDLRLQPGHRLGLQLRVPPAGQRPRRDRLCRGGSGRRRRADRGPRTLRARTLPASQHAPDTERAQDGRQLPAQLETARCERPGTRLPATPPRGWAELRPRRYFGQRLKLTPGVGQPQPKPGGLLARHPQLPRIGNAPVFPGAFLFPSRYRVRT